jgi:hypothetical protein
MYDQRIGGDREHLIEDKKGEEIASESYADRSRDTNGKESKEPLPSMRSLHVSDGVDRGYNPQSGRQHGKEHPQGIDPQDKPYTPSEGK